MRTRLAVPPVFCLCAILSAPAAYAADPELLGLVPADSGVLIGIDIGQISSSRFGQAIYSQIQGQSGDLINLTATPEFELVRGMSEILIAAPGGKQKNRGVFLVRGSFSPAGLQAIAKGTAESSFQGFRILTKPQKQPLSVAILSASLLLGGDPQSVREAIARRSLPGSPDPVLIAKARELSASYDVWLVARTSLADYARPAPPSQLGSLASDLEKSIEQISAGLKFGPMLRVSVDLTTRTEKDARSMADAFKMLIGMAMTGQNARQMKPVLDNLQLRAEANSVKLAIAIPEDEVMTAVQQAGARRATKSAGNSEVVVQGSSPQGGGVVIQSSPSDMGVVTLPGPKPQ
jgi:hypothetical protein